MRHAIPRGGRSAVPLALAAVASGAAPASTGADPGRRACVAPDVVDVSLARAREVLLASGCAATTRQLPAGGELFTPPSPDGRQLVGAQSPGAGARTGSVTLSLRPLCSQPSAPGPDTHGASVAKGPTELVSGVFLEGGPLRISARCRHGRPSPGVLTVMRTDGTTISTRSVRAGRYGVFPLKPGSYLISGALAGKGSPPATALPVTVVAHSTTHLDVVTAVR